MNRTTLIAFYKEIMSISENMGSTGYNLVSTRSGNKQNYQMHLIMPMDDDTKQQVSYIAKKHNLAMIEEKEEIVVYRALTESHYV